MKKLLSVLALTAMAALGTDASGKWSGSFLMSREGEQRDETAYLDLKQDGQKITGTAGPNVEKQFPIKTGSIDGNQIRLQVDSEDAIIYLDLIMDGDRITGNAKGERQDGQKMTAKLDLKRLK